MAEHFTITCEKIGETTILNPSGFVDDISTCSFQHTLSQRYSEGHIAIVIDLHKVNYLVSSCLGLLISTTRQLEKKGGKLCLCGAAGSVKTMLDATRIGRQIPIFDTLEEALAACKHGTSRE